MNDEIFRNEKDQKEKEINLHEIMNDMNDMLDFFETVTEVYVQYERIPTDRLKDLFCMSNKLTSIVEQVSRN